MAVPTKEPIPVSLEDLSALFYRVTRRQGVSPDDAGDVVQEAIAALLERPAPVPSLAFASYAFGILHHKIADCKRRRRAAARRRTPLDELGPHEPLGRPRISSWSRRRSRRSSPRPSGNCAGLIRRCSTGLGTTG